MNEKCIQYILYTFCVHYTFTHTIQYIHVCYYIITELINTHYCTYITQGTETKNEGHTQFMFPTKTEFFLLGSLENIARPPVATTPWEVRLASILA